MGANLIPNSGFETDMTGWLPYGADSAISRVTTDPRSGVACAQVVSGPAAARGIFTEPIPASPRPQFRFAVWVRGVGKVRISIRQATANDATTLSWIDSAYSNITAAWQRFEMIVPGQATVETARVYVASSIASTTFFIDDAVLDDGVDAITLPILRIGSPHIGPLRAGKA